MQGLENKQVYCLQLSGINCTNCEAKIKKNLIEKVQVGLVKVSVNILQEKVSITIIEDEALQKSVQVLQDLGYKIIGEPMMLQGGDASTRTVGFLYEINLESEELESIIRKTAGIVRVDRVHLGESIKLTVSYDSNVIKGREIADIIEPRDPDFKVINLKIQSFQSGKQAERENISIRTTVFLCFFFLIFDMFLPLTGMWYHNFLLFPSQNVGPFTISVICNITLTIIILNVYAKPFIVRSYRNYTQHGSMDMETLISLGCISAFVLFCFFMAKSIYELILGLTSDTGKVYVISAREIMEINDALASSSIIVLVVTIGKYFQGKVKKKIDQMTERIFPESTLFEKMLVKYVRLKNRKLTIEEKKSYDVTLLEKDDLFILHEGRLLVDTFVVTGQFQAIKSAVDGNDEIMRLGKGDRIESGSIILNCSNEALLQVENVFEKSILVEIGNQIKVRQNEEENSQSGIQAVCKTISKYFVKAVIMISLLVMATWFFLLSFDYVRVPGCNFCWIVERGIGVLVASCPCALGLAVPSVVAIVLNIAIKNGILIRNSGVLQKMKKCKIISFDKTGTLFTRINEIEQFKIFENETTQKLGGKLLWQIIAIVQKKIQHPLAEILYKEAFKRSEIQGTNFDVILNHAPEVTKEGLKTEILLKSEQRNIKVLIGNERILHNNKVEVPAFIKTGKGSTILYLSLNQTVCMVIVLNTHSNLRPEAVQVVQLLMKSKKQVHILSGDSRESVEQLGKALRLPEICLHPEHSAFMKEEWIKETQRNIEDDNGIGVIMVGDGLNDIPCLQAASIGVSINAKSELNINASDIIMLSQNLYKILAMVKLLQRGNTFININLFWAFIYNITIMPVVAGLFYGYDLTISPVWSSVAMSCSSILVVSFSHLLALFTYDESPQASMEIFRPKNTTMIEMGQQSTNAKNYNNFMEQTVE